MTTTQAQQDYIIACLVENKPGVLYEVACMFRRRNFNIDSISVGTTEEKDLARMTIAVKGNDWTVEQVVKQLRKLIDVIRVTSLDPKDSVIREMALVKTHVSSAQSRLEILQYVDIFRGRVIDVASDSVTAEITGDADKVDAYVDLMRPFGVKEIARTGITALARGGKAIRE